MHTGLPHRSHSVFEGDADRVHVALEVRVRVVRERLGGAARMVDLGHQAGGVQRTMSSRGLPRRLARSFRAPLRRWIVRAPSSWMVMDCFAWSS